MFVQRSLIRRMARRLVVPRQSELDIQEAALWYEDPRVGSDSHFPYSMYFAESADGVAVLAVLHLHREPDMWKSRN